LLNQPCGIDFAEGVIKQESDISLASSAGPGAVNAPTMPLGRICNHNSEAHPAKSLSFRSQAELAANWSWAANGDGNLTANHSWTQRVHGVRLRQIG